MKTLEEIKIAWTMPDHMFLAAGFDALSLYKKAGEDIIFLIEQLELARDEIAELKKEKE